MEEQRLQVLDMLEAGTITAQQANELLVALGDELVGTGIPEGPQQRHVLRKHDHPGHRERPGHSPRHGRHGREERRESVRMLTAAAMHGVSPSFIQELRELGIDNLSLKEITELSMHGVTAEYIRDMRDAGYDHLNAKELAELSMHGVTAEFAREMQRVGFANLDTQEDEDATTDTSVIDPGESPEVPVHIDTNEENLFDTER